MVNLRKEFNKLIEKQGGFGIGKWVLLRNFTDEYSEFWNDAYKESIGGPKYKYHDNLIRSFSLPSSFGMSMTEDGLTRIEPGDISTESFIYYVKNDVSLKKEDIIFDLDCAGKDKPEVVYDLSDEDLSKGKVAPKRKAVVMKVVPFSSDTAGEIDFKKVFAEEHPL